MFNLFKSLDHLFMAVTFAEAGETETATQLMKNKHHTSKQDMHQKEKPVNLTRFSPKPVVHPS